jgi:hypothetical protein
MIGGTMGVMKFSAFALASLMIAMPLVASAHATLASFEKEVPQGYIDIGYDPDPVKAGGRLLLNLDLLQEKGGASVPFDQVWVRVHEDSKTYLATGVGRARLGPTTVLLQLPENTTEKLSLFVRFEKNGTPVAEAEFPVPVETVSPVSRYAGALLMLVFGLVIGAVVSYGVMRRQKRQ